MVHSNGARLGGRILLALLTLYALAMIAPDFLRIVRPLGSFGLATNADGLIYDVQGPFETEEQSPAWRAGLRVGDRLDFAGMSCVPVDTKVCASNLALWGGVTYVMPGREATLLVEAAGDRPARTVTLIAEPSPRSIALNIVLLLDQIAGVLVVLGAAYLIWIRPGPMTWGFFAYTIYFNPGQAFQFYGWLQQWPWALLIQNVASCVLQAAGYTGLLLFALRAPVDRAEGRWRRVERALPALAILFLAVALMSLGSAFGYRTEFAMQSSILIGFAVSAAALGILLGRRKGLSPRDTQRIRWVIWGCLIGMPAYLIAEISQETSLPASLFGGGAVTEDVSGLIYLINGILCLFVVEAVRRPTVVSVWIPLRRATLLGLLLSVPAFFIHEELSTINEWTSLPEWAWVLVASVLVFLISRSHEWATHLADRLFDRDFRRAEERLAAVGQTIQRADSSPRSSACWWTSRCARSASPRRRCFARKAASSAGASARGGTAPTPRRLPAARRRSGTGSTKGHSASMRAAPPTRPARGFPATWRGLFSASPSAMRGAASRSFSMAVTKPEPIWTTTSATSWAASSARRRSPMVKWRAKCCEGESMPWSRNSRGPPSGAESEGSDGTRMSRDFGRTAASTSSTAAGARQ